jgi:hypothetical protein
LAFSPSKNSIVEPEGNITMNSILLINAGMMEAERNYIFKNYLPDWKDLEVHVPLIKDSYSSRYVI